MNKLTIPVFIIIVLAQLFVPGQMIWQKEMALVKGKEFRFETAPVDPSNPFKGKYIHLDFKSNSYYSSDSHYVNQEELYVELGVNKQGFAEIRKVSREKPITGTDYVLAKADYIETIGNDQKVRIDYPFSEYYMNEYNASKAEELYRSSNRDTVKKTFAIVKVFNGKAVIRDIIINGRSIDDWFK